MTVQRTSGRPVSTAVPSPTPSEPAPTPTPAPAPAPTPSPAATKAAEKLLKLAGFNPGKVDGKASAETTQALKDFQTAWGLPTTGLADTRTLEKLRHTATRIQKHAKAKDDFVGVGQRSNSIKTLEKRLRKLGYDTGKADGIFGRDTAKAVEAFRKDQKELGDGVGYLNKKSRASLRREAAAFEHAPERRRVKPSSEQVRADRNTAKAAARQHADGTVGFGLGSEGPSIKNIQARLKAAGFDPKHVNGKFDERTEGALKAFQRKAGLEPSGRVDSQTWKQLHKSLILSKTPASPAQDVGERSRAVLQSEKLLKQLGFNPGKVDGLFDRNTLKASRAFERKHGGGTDGSIGAAQFNKMGRLVREQGVTLNQLRRIMPDLPLSKAKAYLPHLNKAMAEAKINTEQRKAMFLAQLAHESVQLRYFEEIASGAAYEGRRDLGNIHPGDGVRFKGRGPIQLTGRNNYRAAGKALGLDLEKNPRQVSRPGVGFRTSAWFWTSRGLNRYADQGNFREVTRRINGGFNGYADRLKYYQRALSVL